MSISLTPVGNPEGESVDMSNGTFRDLCSNANVPWDGNHDEKIYSAEQLIALAGAIPKDWPEMGFREGLLWLASCGGATIG